MRTKLILVCAIAASMTVPVVASTPVVARDGFVVKQGQGYHRYNPYKGCDNSNVSIGIGFGFGGFYPGYYGGYGYPGFGYGYGFGYPGFGYGYGCGYPGYGYGYYGGYYGGYRPYYAPGYSSANYRYGYNGNVVARVQQRLARAGYYRGAIDGVIGPRTHYAIRAYERQHGLPADGEIDRRLLATLGLA